MNGSLETVALKWDAIIRETAEKTLNVIVILLSLTVVK